MHTNSDLRWEKQIIQQISRRQSMNEGAESV